ncbi:MAG: dihydrofolate reductase [Rhodospirillaceae bacterium]
MSARVALIAAAAENGAIGLDGGMPWHISADLKYFKRVTMGAPVIMGRKTYESIGAALPGRANIVVTRNRDFAPPDADAVHDVDAALRKAGAIAEIDGSEEVFVIGGAEIYAQALAAADCVYLTEIAGDFPGDAFFPELPASEWREVSREPHGSERAGGPAFSFVVYARMR